MSQMSFRLVVEAGLQIAVGIHIFAHLDKKDVKIKKGCVYQLCLFDDKRANVQPSLHP